MRKERIVWSQEKLFFEKRLLKKEKGNQLISGEKEHSRMIKADREEGLSGLSRLYIFSKAREQNVLQIL